MKTGLKQDLKRDLKVGDLLRDYKEWQELFQFAADLMTAGERTQNAAVYIAGQRIAQLLGRLANKKVELGADA